MIMIPGEIILLILQISLFFLKYTRLILVLKLKRNRGRELELLTILLYIFLIDASGYLTIHLCCIFEVGLLKALIGNLDILY
jgi:hypothetical protein